MLLKILKAPLVFSRKRVESYGAQYKVFGAFAVINYIIPYFMWSQQNYNNDMGLTLRVIAGGLCVPLMFSYDVSGKWQKYLPFYWHLTLLYCLPFFTTYMLLSNKGSTSWLMNVGLALFLLALLVDWLSFIVIIVLGVLLGSLFYMQMFGPNAVMLNAASLNMAIYTYIFATLIGFLFSRNRQLIEEEKYATLKTLGGVIAHEMRTPLTALAEGSRAIQEYFPILVRGCEEAQKAKLPIETLDPHRLAYLKELPNDHQATAQSALSMIDIFLMNLREFPTEEGADICSIKQCVEIALEEYPFFPNDKELIHWKGGPDFHFKGNSALVKHIIFNLLKNAIYHVRAANKGEITLWTECANFGNILYFKDTGTGISARVISRIFDRFYTQSKHGTGIGLAFCKLAMESFGGNITCHSLEGEYTFFSLYFPFLEGTEPQPAVSSGSSWLGFPSF